MHTWKIEKFENKRRRQKIMEKVEGGGADEERLSFFFFFLRVNFLRWNLISGAGSSVLIQLAAI